VSATDLLLAELEDWARAHGPAPEMHRYGSGPEHQADLLLGVGLEPHPVAVLLHGGFWGARYTRTIMGALAVDLARRGWATWNVEYRRIGSDGGAQQTLADVRAAIDAVPKLDGALSTERLLVIGHSAGGQLALCAAAASAVAAVVSLAGVCDLVVAAEDRLGDDAVVRFIGGGPHERPDEYRLANPRQQLPTGVPVLLVHGDADARVPVQQSRDYAAAAQTSGDRCELLELTGVDHFALIDPRTTVWATVADRLPALLG
jgi:dipeptidyl aminopeptidase/acylaminoacyl peptidase